MKSPVFRSRDDYLTWVESQGGLAQHPPECGPAWYPCVVVGLVNPVRIYSVVYSDEFGSAEADDLRGELNRLRSEAEDLRSRLPDGMEYCKIILKQCPKGHAWLTASNWVEHSCPACELEEAEAAFKVTQRMAMLYADLVDECAGSAFSRDDGNVPRWDGRTTLLHLKEFPGRIRELNARVAELESLVKAQAERIASQSEALSRRAERGG